MVSSVIVPGGVPRRGRQGIPNIREADRIRGRMGATVKDLRPLKALDVFLGVHAVTVPAERRTKVHAAVGHR